METHMIILNLTQHLATPTQIAAGVVEPAPAVKAVIKQLLDVIEMARSEAQRSGGEGASISPVTFLECLTVRGL